MLKGKARIAGDTASKLTLTMFITGPAFFRNSGGNASIMQ
jgi:hypothetical protein